MNELYIALPVNDETTRAQLAAKQTLISQNTTGDWEPPETFHVTIDFLGEVSSDDTLLVVEAMKRLEANAVDLGLHGRYVFVHGVHRFNHGVIWLGLDQSMVLYKINHALREYMADLGYQHRKDDFDGYTPHITMGYECGDVPDLPDDAPGVPLHVGQIVLWNSPKCNGTYIENSLYIANL